MRVANERRLSFWVNMFRRRLVKVEGVKVCGLCVVCLGVWSQTIDVTDIQLAQWVALGTMVYGGGSGYGAHLENRFGRN